MWPFSTTAASPLQPDGTPGSSSPSTGASHASSNGGAVVDQQLSQQQQQRAEGWQWWHVPPKQTAADALEQPQQTGQHAAGISHANAHANPSPYPAPAARSWWPFSRQSANSTPSHDNTPSFSTPTPSSALASHQHTTTGSSPIGIVDGLSSSSSSSGSSTAEQPGAAVHTGRSLELVEVQPLHVVLGGVAVMALGAAFTGVATYRSEAKSLAEEGIDPSAQRKIIPVAMKTLFLSSILTGCLGVAGFAALKASGLITADRAELPSAGEVARFMQQPRTFVAELVAGERQRERDRRAADTIARPS